MRRRNVTRYLRTADALKMCVVKVYMGGRQMTAVSYKRTKICACDRGDKTVTLLSKSLFHAVPETNISSL